jgi:hypothetical protein
MKRDRNVDRIEGAKVTSDGSPFQTLAPSTGNEQSSLENSLDRGTDRRCDAVERRPERPHSLVNSETVLVGWC